MAAAPQLPLLVWNPPPPNQGRFRFLVGLEKHAGRHRGPGTQCGIGHRYRNDQEAGVIKEPLPLVQSLAVKRGTRAGYRRFPFPRPGQVWTARPNVPTKSADTNMAPKTATAFRIHRAIPRQSAIGGQPGAASVWDWEGLAPVDLSPIAFNEKGRAFTSRHRYAMRALSKTRTKKEVIFCGSDATLPIDALRMPRAPHMQIAPVVDMHMRIRRVWNAVDRF